MCPADLDTYTDNDILEDVYRSRKERSAKENSMKRQAWYTWICSTNRPIFGQKEFEFRPFDDLFPDNDTPPPVIESPSEIVAACEKMGIRPPTRF